VSLLILLLSQSLFARLYGASGRVYEGTEGRQTSDGGYIITGYSDQNSNDLLLLKLNSSGGVSWADLFGGANDDAGYSLVISTDGGYAVAGHTLSYGAGSYDLFVLKTSSGGSFQWAKAIGGSGWDEARSIIQTTDGGYLVAGYAYVSNNTQAVLVKLNSSGGVQWAKHYGGSNADEFFCVIRTTDGGYAAVGETNSAGAGSRDVLVVKTSSDGTVQWANAYGRAYEDLGLSIVQASDGTYFVAGSGYALSGSYSSADFLIMKLNTDGTVAWSKVLDQNYSGDTAVSLILLSDGSILATGRTSVGAGYRDILLAKFSSSGTLQGAATIGGTGWDSWYGWEGSRAISPASDGRFLITATTNSSGPGSQNIFFFKVGSNLSYSNCLVSQSFSLSSPTLTRTGLSWSDNTWSPTVTDLNLTPTNPSISTSNFCEPVYEEVEEHDASGPALFCSTAPDGLLFVSTFNAEISLYSPDGRLVYSGQLREGSNRITLGRGVYLWRAGGCAGKAVVR